MPGRSGSHFPFKVGSTLPARRVHIGQHCQAGDGGIEEIWVPRYYRGRLVGFVVREDLRGAMRRRGQLDRIAERLGPPDPSAPDFDTLLDMIDPQGRIAVETDAMLVRTRPQRQFPGG